MAEPRGAAAASSAPTADDPSTIALLGLVLTAWSSWQHRNGFAWCYVATPIGRVSIESAAGRVQAKWSNARREHRWDVQHAFRQVPEPRAPDFYRFRGEGVADVRLAGVTVVGQMFEPFCAVTAPAGVVMVLLALLPLRWWFTWPLRVRWDREAAGGCAACGYDLRGTPGRCPECGVVPERPTQAAT